MFLGRQPPEAVSVIWSAQKQLNNKGANTMIMSTTADFHVGRPRQRVLALHCSGADHRQWRKLRTALEPEFELIAPDFYGCEATGPWHGARRFSLAEEAAAIIELIDDLNESVHLVGHSYGGGVALKVAIERPGSIRSLALYEPSAFHILRQLGEEGAAEFAEIRALADDVGMNILRGAYQAAARSFVDYWNGHGAWDELRAEVRTALLRWLPKAPLDFAALIEEPTPISAYRVLCCPVLLLRGEYAPRPSRKIVDELVRLVPCGRAEIVSKAGHMGPITHGEEIAAQIARHVCRAAKRAITEKTFSAGTNYWHRTMTAGQLHLEKN